MENLYYLLELSSKVGKLEAVLELLLQDCKLKYPQINFSEYEKYIDRIKEGVK